ncbi:MAG: hypothetical protein ACI9CF_001390 [Candidatus Omnitrophota bacterium]|jgi:hypothetical protein
MQLPQWIPRISPGHVLIGLLMLGASVTFFSSKQINLTYDEPAHIQYGISVTRGVTNRIDDSKMPITALNMLPSQLSKKVTNKDWKVPLRSIELAKSITILFYILLAIIVFVWTRELYGLKAALISTTFLLFDPNIQAHARLITTDLYAATFITYAIYTFWNFSKDYSMEWGLVAAIALGMAQLAKFSAIYLYPLFIGIFIIQWLLRKKLNIFTDKTEPQHCFLAVKWVIFFICISLIIINAGYLFNGFGTPLSQYTFKSELFQTTTKLLGPLKDFFLPLPKPFVEGLDWTKFNEVSGAYRGKTYFLGELSRDHFLWYFPLLFLLKIPLPALISLAGSKLLFLKRKNIHKFTNHEMFLILPAAFFAFYFIFLCKAQMGIRMTLMLFPLMYIFSGKFFKRIKSPIALGLILWLIISNLSYYPRYIPYFNELVTPRINASKYFADSNLDWGQNQKLIQDYQMQHPNIKINPFNPVTGKVAISVNFVLGIVDPYRFAWYEWIQKNLKPIGHVGYSYLIYDVPPQALIELRTTLPLIKQRIHKEFNPD